MMNIKDFNPKPDSCTLYSVKLDWNDAPKEGYYDTLTLATTQNQDSLMMKDIKLDYVIGSDIVYWPTSINPLLNVLNILFERNPGLIFYICYIERVVNVHKALLKGFSDNGFTVEEIGMETSKPIDAYSFIYKVTKSNK